MFLSYARKDMALADQLQRHLEAQGCSVRMDRGELLTGDTFVLGIQREIPSCDGLVLLLTPLSSGKQLVLGCGPARAGASPACSRGLE